jgi:exodeoxyribonuclease VII small subunit
MTKEKEMSLGESLKQLEAITEWFDQQETIDVERALEKVKEGAKLLRSSREKLKQVENEFQVIRQELEQE